MSRRSRSPGWGHSEPAEHRMRRVGRNGEGHGADGGRRLHHGAPASPTARSVASISEELKETIQCAGASAGISAGMGSIPATSAFSEPEVCNRRGRRGEPASRTRHRRS